MKDSELPYGLAPQLWKDTATRQPEIGPRVWLLDHLLCRTSKQGQDILYINFSSCIGFVGQGFGSRGSYRGDCCVKFLETSPMSDKANANLREGNIQGKSHTLSSLLQT